MNLFYISLQVTLFFIVFIMQVFSFPFCFENIDISNWLTYAGVMVPDVEKISTASALIASPSILAAAFRALTGLFIFAFIDICLIVKEIKVMK